MKHKIDWLFWTNLLFALITLVCLLILAGRAIKEALP